MKFALKFVMALIVTTLLMLAFRALVFTVYTVRGTALEPCLVDGDRVLVNRWSYGLRAGGYGPFGYARWIGSQVERGDLVVFNNPADTARHIPRRKTMAYYCTAVPGDTVRAGGALLTVPGKGSPCRVNKGNIRLLRTLYNRFEGKKAEIIGGKLIVNGKETSCAVFNNDYYWVSASRRGDTSDSRFFGFVPETHVIGKVKMLIFSADPGRPIGHNLRQNRWLMPIGK